MFKCGIDNDWQLVCVVQKNDFTFRLNMLLRSTKSIRDWSSWIMNHYYLQFERFISHCSFQKEKKAFLVTWNKEGFIERKTLKIRSHSRIFYDIFHWWNGSRYQSFRKRQRESTLDKECKSCTSMFCCLPSESVLAPSLEKYQKFFSWIFFRKVIHTHLPLFCLQKQ